MCSIATPCAVRPVGPTAAVETPAAPAAAPADTGAAAGRLAHDLRNLWFVVAGNLDLIGDRYPDDLELAELIDDVCQAVARGTDLSTALAALAQGPAAPADGAASAASDRDAGDRRAPSRETILVVDDARAYRRLVRRQLSRLGYRVLEAASAEAAIERLDAEAGVDLVLTDVQAGGALDGAELAFIVGELHPATKVILTAGDAHPSIATATAAGVPLLVKPYSMAALAALVRRTLDGAAGMRPCA